MHGNITHNSLPLEHGIWSHYHERCHLSSGTCFMGYIFDFFTEEEWSLVVLKLVILRETKRGRPNKTFQANFSGIYK